MTDTTNHQAPDQPDGRARLAISQRKVELLDRRVDAVEIFGRAMAAARDAQKAIIAAGKWDQGYCGDCWIDIDQSTDIAKALGELVKFVGRYSFKHEGRLRFSVPRTLGLTQSLDDNEALTDAFVGILNAAGITTRRVSYSD